MGTSFNTIYDRALMVIDDYHLNELAQTNTTSFIKFWQGILTLSVPLFIQCENDLTYDVAEESFNSTLTEMEINILSEIMVLNWFEGKTNIVSQFELKLTNREFKTYSESANLKEKRNYLNRLREKYRQDIEDYQLSPENFESIFNW
jgi:hypothetical protein